MTPSASRQLASTSALGGAHALPSPDLTVDEIDTLAEVEEVAAVELADQITRCSSVQSGGSAAQPLHVQHHDEEVALANFALASNLVLGTSAIEFFCPFLYIEHVFPSGV